jgi:hypothetical protein
MDIKQFLKDIKAKFNGEVVPPAPAPPAPATPTAKVYKLADGTEITINQVGETPAAGDTVTIAGAPAPANTYTLPDGATIVVDAMGVITVYTAMAAPAPPPPPAPAPAPAAPVTLSAEEVKAMYEKFATGSTEERMSNLEVMVKALMECNFGYEIRKGQEAAAIETYKENLASLQTAVDSAKAEMQSAFAKVEAQQEEITKHKQTIKDLFELVEQLVETPTADPVTLTGRQKEKFDKAVSREQRFEKIAEALKTKKTLA